MLPTADSPTCLLCNKEIDEKPHSSAVDQRYHCSICGEVALQKEFPVERYRKVRHILSGWTRERSEKQEKTMIIMADDAPPVEDGIAVKAILNLPTIPHTIDEQIMKLLEAIHRKSAFFGDEISIKTSQDYPFAYLEHFERSGELVRPFSKMLSQVIKLGWLNRPSGNIYKVELTIEGLRVLEKARRVTPETFDCFIAMPFGDELLDRIYKEAMVPAILAAGYRPIQMAYLEHNNNIIDEMLGNIKRSRFLVADLTHQNQNVYYEAGFAQGLGIPVTYTVHEEHADDIKFDTQHTNQIRWTDSDELQINVHALRHNKQ